MSTLLKTFAVCSLLLTLTSCQYLRGPCGLWPYEGPTGGEPVTQTFSSAEGRFRIGLPAKDERPAADPNNNVKTFKWFLLNVGPIQVLYFDSANAVDSPEVSQRVLDNFRNQVSSHGKLVGESEISVSGHPGREFTVRTERGTQIDRIYLSENRVYVVGVFVSDRLDCKLGSAIKILDTFEIVDTQ